MEIICICCPLGCRVNIQKEGDGFLVVGNRCPRGREYAIDELTAPVRTITSSVPTIDCVDKTLSVKTDKPIAKDLVFKALDVLKGVKVKPPIKEGDIIVSNVLETSVNFVATRDIE